MENRPELCYGSVDFLATQEYHNRHIYTDMYRYMSIYADVYICIEVYYALSTFWLSKSTTTGIYRCISVDLLVYRYISVHIGTPAYTYIYANIYTNIYMYNISGQRCIRHTYSRSIPLPTPRRSADMYRYIPIYSYI